MKSSKDSSKEKQGAYESLVARYDKAQVGLERAKTKEKSAKHLWKTADKSTPKINLEILELEYEKLRFRRKARKASLKIAKILLKNWAKTHEEQTKEYALAEAEPVKKSHRSKSRSAEDKPVIEFTTPADSTPSVVDVVEEKVRKPRGKAAKKMHPVEAPVAEIVEEVTAKPRGRKPKNTPEVAQQPVTAEVEKVSKPRGRKPMPKPIVEEVQIQTTEVTEKIAKPRGKAARKPDDFTIIEGIGAKVTAILHDKGIKTFAKLATQSVDSLKALMKANRNYLVNPTTWPEQAQLAADGKMEELEALKATLYKGRKG